MRSIKELQCIKFDKEGYEFIDEVADVRDVWGLIMFTYTPRNNNDNSKFSLQVNPDVVGMVIQYNDGRFECKLSKVDFQVEYAEDKLKQIIIDDIVHENLLQESFKMFTNVTEGFRNVKQMIETVNNLDDSLTDLKKTSEE